MVVAKTVRTKIMKRFSPPWLFPLNMYEIIGNLCCVKLKNQIEQNPWSHQSYCYHARTLFESNSLFIWGSLSSKLINQVHIFLSYLPKRHAVVHVQGCRHKSPFIKVPNVITIDTCAFDNAVMKSTIKEARACLIA